MACAEGGCHGCPFSNYDYQYGEMWCNNEDSCPRGIINRRINHKERPLMRD